MRILGDGSMDEDDNLPTHTVEVNVDKRRKSLPGTAATPGTVGGQNNKREWWNIRCYCLIVIVVACYSFYFFKFVLLHCNSHEFPLLHFPSVYFSSFFFSLLFIVSLLLSSPHHSSLFHTTFFSPFFTSTLILHLSFLLSFSHHSSSPPITRTVGVSGSGTSTKDSTVNSNSRFRSLSPPSTAKTAKASRAVLDQVFR